MRPQVSIPLEGKVPGGDIPSYCYNLFFRLFHTHTT